MAILPMAPPEDRQESMFEPNLEAQPEALFDVEVDEVTEVEEGFADSTEFLASDAYELDETVPTEAEIEVEPEMSAAVEDAGVVILPETQPAESAVIPQLPESADPFSDASRKEQAEASSDALPEPLNVLTVDDFAALENRVLRAVTLVRQERQARLAAEQRSAELEAKLSDLQAKVPVVEGLEQEISSLRVEREQVRQRVERLLSQLDALEL